MRDNRTDPFPEGAPDPASTQYHAERVLLKELLVDPPPEGDAIEQLAVQLELTQSNVRAAASRLIELGLVEAVGNENTLRAHHRARYFDHLLPFGA